MLQKKGFVGPMFFFIGLLIAIMAMMPRPVDGATFPHTLWLYGLGIAASLLGLRFWWQAQKSETGAKTTEGKSIERVSPLLSKLIEESAGLESDWDACNDLTLSERVKALLDGPMSQLLDLRVVLLGAWGAEASADFLLEHARAERILHRMVSALADGCAFEAKRCVSQLSLAFKGMQEKVQN